MTNATPWFKNVHRRSFLKSAACLPWVPALIGSDSVYPANAQSQVGFGYSLYGMKALEIAAALELCHEIGYDCVELPVMPDWPGATNKLTSRMRSEIRESLKKLGLRLTSLMENLHLLTDDATHLANQDRLKGAAELARELSPDRVPLIETILGGRPGEWEAVREQMVQRLRDWNRIAEAFQVRIAIKAHVAGAAHLPQHIRWLVDQVNSPWIRPVFDYSHFQLRNLGLDESLRILSKDAIFVHIKDGAGDPGKIQFLLPGEGTIDYVRYFQLLKDANYSGDVVVEVSGQIHSKSNFDPIAAAKQCYAAIAPKFAIAGLSRT